MRACTLPAEEYLDCPRLPGAVETAEGFAQADACFQALSGCWAAVERRRIDWKLLSLGAVGAFPTSRLTTFNPQAFAFAFVFSP